MWVLRLPISKCPKSVMVGPGRVGPVHFKNGFYVQNKGFFALVQNFEKSVLKLLKRGCQTHYDLSISLLGLRRYLRCLRFASLAIMEFFKN